jgi:hypothetical protein
MPLGIRCVESAKEAFSNLEKQKPIFKFKTPPRLLTAARDLH